MSTVRFRGRDIILRENESVLDALLRSDIAVTHSCRAGVCGSCLLRASGGAVPQRAQAGMRDSWKARGYFYSCVCVPESDLDVAATDGEVRLSAAISSLQLLSSDVMRVRMVAAEQLDFHAGQYITIVRGTVARSYSIASLPEDQEIELHVRKIPGGQMSGWFHDDARPGDRVTFVGPSGECFYLAGRPEQPLVLAGTGTGLAPLVGIVRAALQNNHRGSIHLFHGALHEGGLYLVDELRELARTHANLTYIPAVLRSGAMEGTEVGPIDAVIVKHVPKLAGYRGFVCGDPGLVQMLKKKLFLAGMASREIYADAFLPAAVS